MSEKNFINYLTSIVLFCVGLVSILSFTLSYDVLYHQALSGGKPVLLAYIWPLIIDIPIIAFSLVALLLVFLGMPAHLSRFGVLAATLLTIGFNYRYAVDQNLNWMVAVVAPIMYAASFEFMIMIIRLVAKRSISVREMSDIGAKLNQSRRQYENEQDKLDKLKGQIIEAKETIEVLRADILAKRQEADQANDGAITIYVPDNLTPTMRQMMVKKMVNDGLTNEAIAKALEVSVSTIKGDKRAIQNQNGNK